MDEDDDDDEEEGGKSETRASKVFRFHVIRIASKIAKNQLEHRLVRPL